MTCKCHTLRFSESYNTELNKSSVEHSCHSFDQGLTLTVPLDTWAPQIQAQTPLNLAFSHRSHANRTVKKSIPTPFQKSYCGALILHIKKRSCFLPRHLCHYYSNSCKA